MNNSRLITPNLQPTLLNRIVWVLLLALLVRVVWLAFFPTNPIAPVDAEGFHLLAVNMRAGRGFAIGWEPPFCPTMVRTPLYPLFVAGIYALVGADPGRALLFHLLLEALTTALVVRLGCDLGGKRVGWCAGLLYACNGTTQRYTGYLLAEALLLPLLTASVWLTLRCLRRPTRKKAALAGFFWGLALLTKPNVQFLALFIGGLLTWRMANHELRITNDESRFTFDVLRSTFVFWLTLGLTLFPWLSRNRIVFDRWALSTAFEENLARVAVVATLAEVENVRVEPWTETWEYYYDRFSADAAARDDWDGRALWGDGCVERQRRQVAITRAARDLVRAHPLSYLRAHLRGVLTSLRDPGHRLWYHVLTGAEWESTGVVADIGARMMWALERGAVGDALRALWLERVARPPLLAALLWWGLGAARVAVWIGGLRGAWCLRRRPWALWVFLGMVAYIVMLPGPIAYDRFYLPAIPAVIVLVLTGVLQPVRTGGTIARGCPDCWNAV